ncbi:MAG: glycosyltransferase family 1 protein [Bacteroidota bacterium]
MRIGIILTGDYGWAGGVYYAFNVIKLLQDISLTKELKIIVIVNSFTPQELINGLRQKNTEFCSLDKKSFFYRLYHKIRNDRFIADINALSLDVVYPMMSFDESHFKLNCKAYYWLYDFQHKFLPGLFKEEEIKKRERVFEQIAAKAQVIVFSSNDALSHFNRYYPASNAERHVFNFVSLLDHNFDLDKTTIHTPRDYFIVCNQFWPHKNHLVVLKALDQLLKQKKSVHVVFTGRYDDERNKTYVDELNEFINRNHLQKHVTFTGFISREEQVTLMANAMAMIQPSFFEGWSTVIEDAKALNKFLLASDIAVNREQIKKNVRFFKPDDSEQLAAQLAEIYEGKINVVATDYTGNITTAKNDLIKLFKI